MDASSQFYRVLGKVKGAVSDPGTVVPYIRRRLRTARVLAATVSHKLATLYLLDQVDGGDRFRSHLQAHEEQRYPDCGVLDFRMRVDLLDEGLSRDLLLDGHREPIATARYREELARLEAERGGLTVVDIGANIGYFVLVYLTRCRLDGRAIAIEPLRESYALLRENLRLNGVEDRVECHRCAIGQESRSASIHVSRHRNLSAVVDIGSSHYTDEVTVPMRSLDGLLESTNVPPGSVDVLRMDIQGYEYEVFQGMKRLLAEGNIGLIFCEIHPWILDREDNYDDFLSMLQAAGFEVAFVADGRTAFVGSGGSAHKDTELDIDSFDGLRDVDFTVEVMLRR